MSMNDKECKGCRSYDVNKNPCSITVGLGPIKNTKKGKIRCPCVNCIIKTMCRLACPSFNDFIEELEQSKNHNEYTTYIKSLRKG